ncbi:hypothetical protein MAR_023215 [Mya arenaria]|uniref:Uncharacterized protein n=1 Tax=Mya arenaria TaxID=6604 RepID=A0ABY7DME6_MYAAR|nr:hypothetical protein MAR_023215 [Mya arenaria]
MFVSKKQQYQSLQISSNVSKDCSSTNTFLKYSNLVISFTSIFNCAVGQNAALDFFEEFAVPSLDFGYLLLIVLEGLALLLFDFEGVFLLFFEEPLVRQSASPHQIRRRKDLFLVDFQKSAFHREIRKTFYNIIPCDKKIISRIMQVFIGYIRSLVTCHTRYSFGPEAIIVFVGHVYMQKTVVQPKTLLDHLGRTSTVVTSERPRDTRNLERYRLDGCLYIFLLPKLSTVMAFQGSSCASLREIGDKR